MPEPAPFVLPADAFEKAEAKNRDFYSDLTDEERAEEGLPPREAVKTEAEPAEQPPTTEAEEEEAEEEVEAAKPEQDEATRSLFEEITDLRDQLKEEFEARNAPAKEPERDELMEAALEHEDPVIRALAERLQKQEVEHAAIKAAQEQERIDRQMAKDDADFADIRANIRIAGEKVTNEDVRLVEQWILDHPIMARELSIEEITRVVHPRAQRVDPEPEPEPKPAVKRPAKLKGKDVPTATIIDEGSSGGAPAAPWKPRPNETIESAVRAAAQQFGWVR